MKRTREISNLVLIISALTIGFVVVGCAQKETVLDVDTPDGGVAIERDVDDGSLSVDVDE